MSGEEVKKKVCVWGGGVNPEYSKSSVSRSEEYELSIWQPISYWNITRNLFRFQRGSRMGLKSALMVQFENRIN